MDKPQTILSTPYNNTVLSPLCATVVILVILLWLLTIFENYRKRNEKKTTIVISNFDNKPYRIVENFSPEYNKECADMMAQINLFIQEFINHMRKKYIINGEKHPRYNGTNATNMLIEQYNPRTLKENFPTDLNFTSYVMDKGSEIAFCLHPQGQPNTLHDFDLLKFVILHELAHLASPHIGHPIEFWRIFKIFIEEAVDAKIYTPVNYGIEPIEYCGLKITYSPYYDTSLFPNTL